MYIGEALSQNPWIDTNLTEPLSNTSEQTYMHAYISYNTKPFNGIYFRRGAPKGPKRFCKNRPGKELQPENAFIYFVTCFFVTTFYCIQLTYLQLTCTFTQITEKPTEKTIVIIVYNKQIEKHPTLLSESRLLGRSFFLFPSELRAT